MSSRVFSWTGSTAIHLLLPLSYDGRLQHKVDRADTPASAVNIRVVRGQEAVRMRTWRFAALSLLFLPALLAAQAPGGTDSRSSITPSLSPARRGSRR